MTNPHISLAAKGVFTYFTAYCPPGRMWHFKKFQIIDELGISSYLLNKALNELAGLKLISIAVSQYQISVTNIYDSSEKEGHESSNNEDIRTEKRGHENLNNEDTELKKEGHEIDVNKDTEQYNIYQYNSYQSGPISHTWERDEENDGELREGMSAEEIRELVEKEVSVGTFKKHNCYYLIIALVQIFSKRYYVSKMNALLGNSDLTLSSFMYGFLQRYESKTVSEKTKNPIAYMRTCLLEFVFNYDYLKDEVACQKPVGYAPAYNIAEYESYNFLNNWSDDDI